MQVAQNALVALFVAMGYKTATKWKLEQLTTQVNKIHSLADDDAAELEPAQEKLLKKLIKAAKAGTEISVVAEASTETAAEEEKPVKKGKKPAKAPVPEPEEEDTDETEVDDDEEEEKPVKKGKKPASADKPSKKGPGRPAGGTGVIAEIVSVLKKGTAKKPVTKDQILEHLTEKFPDRSPEAMKSTINIQVPNRLKREKDLNVVKNEKGYFIQSSDE